MRLSEQKWSKCCSQNHGPMAWVALPNIIPLDVLFKADIISPFLLLDVFHLLSTWCNAFKLFIWTWIWGRKSLLTDISGLGRRLQTVCYTVHLCFESAPRTLSLGGLHTFGPILFSFDFSWRWVQSFHRNIFFYFLTVFWSLYNSPPDE